MTTESFTCELLNDPRVERITGQDAFQARFEFRVSPTAALRQPD